MLTQKQYFNSERKYGRKADTSGHRRHMSILRAICLSRWVLEFHLWPGYRCPNSRSVCSQRPNLFKVNMNKPATEATSPLASELMS